MTDLREAARDLADSLEYVPGSALGGKIALVYAALAERCFLCHRSAPIRNGTYVRVGWPDGSVKDICDDCFEKGNEALDETLDMGGSDDD